MVQLYGGSMDPENLYIMFTDFVPKALEEEIIRKEISDFHRGP